LQQKEKIMYYGDFSNTEDVCRAFDIGYVDGVIVFAAYEIDGYEGSADVLYIKDGKIYHVTGSHCSCYGLENQWSPDEMPIEALRHVVENGSYGIMHDHKEGLLSLLEVLHELNLEGAKPETVQMALKLVYG
jgi:hypothetical protein